MPILVTVMILCKHSYMGRIVSVALSVYEYNLDFCFIDIMVCFGGFILFLSPCWLLGKHLHMDRIVSVAASIYGFDPYLCLIDSMIRFSVFCRAHLR